MNRLALQISAALGALAISAGSVRAASLQPAPHAATPSPVSVGRVQADTNRNKLYDNLEATLAVTRADQPLDVIIRFKAGREGTAAQLGDRVLGTLETDHSVTARVSPAEIRRLAASGAVESVEEDTLCYAMRDTSQESLGVTKASADFGLSGDGDGDPRQYSTRDLTIAVIDTGIDPKHPEFAGGNIVGWKDFVNGREQPYDDSGHGTHVASIAAGRAGQGGGVAPGASLIGLKVLSAEGFGTMGTIADAVEWCVTSQLQYGIDIINLPCRGVPARRRRLSMVGSAGGRRPVPARDHDHDHDHDHDGR